MKANLLVGALVAAGVIGTGAAAYRGHWSPIATVQANPAVLAAGVAAPAANPAASSLPLNGFSDIVKSYGPAVVNVQIEGTVKTRAQMQGMPDDVPEEFRDFFRNFHGQVPRATPMRGEGSGFIVSPDGYILTNAHVVENADHVTVRLTDRREFTAKVIGSDKATDVAVIKIDATGLPTVKVGDSRRASVGEWVIAIGSPFGFENSATAGIVSAKARSLPDSTYVPFIQTDVAVNPGNSGGPLFNLAGEVIGINSQIYSRSGGYQGVSFAIPIEIAMNVENQIVKHGKVERGRLGVTVQEVNASLASSFGLDRPRGALVSSIDDGSPAQKAGFQVGDIILSFNGHPIEHSNDLPLLVADSHPGTKTDVEVWRKGRKETLAVAPMEQKAKLASNDDDSKAAARGRLGVVVRPLTAEERSQVGKKALVVEQVSGAAERAGVQPGDLLLQLNGTPVATPEELRVAVSKSGKRAALLIQREDRQLFVPVEMG
ncbi:MAG TPA: DegQ family serine endoprotease [Usitatibacter sp.]|jgi:serine protease Do|nr:DegQ family serine endoprotease [Usitatibacter sp.]